MLKFSSCPPCLNQEQRNVILSSSRQQTNGPKMFCSPRVRLRTPSPKCRCLYELKHVVSDISFGKSAASRVILIALVTTPEQSRRSGSFCPISENIVARVTMNSPRKWLPLTSTSLVITWAWVKPTWSHGDCRVKRWMGQSKVRTHLGDRSIPVAPAGHQRGTAYV
jgi:hypothetical protein